MISKLYSTFVTRELKFEQGYDDKKSRKHLLYKIDVSGKTIAHLQDLLKNSKIRDKEIKFKIGT